MKLGWTIKLSDPSIVMGVGTTGSVRCDMVDNCFIVFRNGNIKIRSYKKLKYQIDTPSIMRKFIGTEIRIEKNFLNPYDGEMFRIYVNASISVRNKNPYFTNEFLYIPKWYGVINEAASYMNVSFARTTVSMIDSGEIQAYICGQKMNGLSASLLRHGSSLRCRVSKSIRELAMDLENFKYVETSEKTNNYKYGVMTFRRVV